MHNEAAITRPLIVMSRDYTKLLVCLVLTSSRFIRFRRGRHGLPQLLCYAYGTFWR